MARRDPDIEIVGECSNGLEALEAIHEKRPDLLLLDVQMPELGGFEVLEALKGSLTRRPSLRHGLRPVRRARLRVSRARLSFKTLRPRARRGGRPSREVAARRARQQNGYLDRRIVALLEQLRGARHVERLVVKNGGRVYFLETCEIDWVEAEGNYINIHTGKKSHLLRETISNLEAQLDPRRFVRIHRSAIVNIARVQELQPWTHGEYHVILHDGTQLTLSRNYRENLQSVLGNSL